ncbi:MAG TPA: hypothetical protein VGX94_03475 [Terriglobia bacterium]|nr:hypothetical protein [Terriglobia bacterium]
MDEKVDEMAEEFRIFAERNMQFMNLWTVYTDLLSGHYAPSLNDEKWSVGMTLMLLLYAYFYSLVEDSEDGVNAFRVWREKFPEEELTIAAIEAQVVPFRDLLRVFRNRLGFHGSRTRRHESPGFDLFAQHKGDEIWNAMKNFKALGAALFAMDLARKGEGKYSREQVRHWIDAVSERARQATARKATPSST